MLDDTGFKHLRVKIMVPGLLESEQVLHRLFENPEVSTTLKEAGIIDGRPFFEIEIFGASSEVDEALGAEMMVAKDLHPSSSRLQEAHA